MAFKKLPTLLFVILCKYISINYYRVNYAFNDRIIKKTSCNNENNVNIGLYCILHPDVNGHFNGEQRVEIMGGDPTTIEKFPYQVSVMYIDSHYCGGSIIGSRFILTAAHCVSILIPEDLLVRVGSTIIDQGGKVYPVLDIKSHPKYNSTSYDFDIAILVLIESVEFSKTVAKVNLPPKNQQISDGTPCIATGWGQLYYDGPIPMELQEVNLPAISRENCLLYHTLTETMFCAGYQKGEKDACKGDSGGPLVANDSLLGITSWGNGCGKPNSPGVYTQVSLCIDYINDVINNYSTIL